MIQDNNYIIKRIIQTQNMNVKEKMINILKQKDFLFLAIPLVLIVIFLFGFFFVTPSTHTQTTGMFINKINPSMLNNFKVATITPQNKAMNVGIFPTIQVVFAQPMSKADQNKIRFTLSPTLSGKQQWSNDKTTFSFFSSSPLQVNTQYTATINYDSSPYSWIFTTVSAENVSTVDQNKAQEAADQKYQQVQKIVDQKYPWLNSLPLQTASYFFYFDTDKKSFIGKLYPKNNISTSIDDQVNAMKTEITTSLANLNIPTAQFSIDWQVTPETATGE